MVRRTLPASRTRTLLQMRSSGTAAMMFAMRLTGSMELAGWAAEHHVGSPPSMGTREKTRRRAGKNYASQQIGLP